MTCGFVFLLDPLQDNVCVTEYNDVCVTVTDNVCDSAGSQGGFTGSQGAWTTSAQPAGSTGFDCNLSNPCDCPNPPSGCIDSYGAPGAPLINSYGQPISTR